MREQIDRQRIEQFLARLGREFHSSGRIYLVGGTTMVFEGLRAQTLDIDLAIDVSDQDHSELIAILQKLKQQLSMNIELASPADFIPLPSGHSERSSFIGRYGQLDVFHFDLYSVALSKIERATGEDISDVLALLNTKRIEMPKLQECFQDIFPRLATDSLKQNPDKFKRNFEFLVQIWQDE